MRAKYPTDRFEVALRKVNATSSPEWRIKCQDCPGKVSFFSIELGFNFNFNSFKNSCTLQVQAKRYQITRYI